MGTWMQRSLITSSYCFFNNGGQNVEDIGNGGGTQIVLLFRDAFIFGLTKRTGRVLVDKEEFEGVHIFDFRSMEVTLGRDHSWRRGLGAKSFINSFLKGRNQGAARRFLMVSLSHFNNRRRGSPPRDG